MVLLLLLLWLLLLLLLIWFVEMPFGTTTGGGGISSINACSNSSGSNVGNLNGFPKMVQKCDILATCQYDLTSSIV